jgi:type IV secretion system protein TrbB
MTNGMSEQKRRLAQKLKSELGSSIMAALSDPSVIEIMLNSDGTLWVEKLGEGMACVGEMSAPNAEALLGTIASSLQTVITREQPILEGELPIDGSRFEGLLPPVVAHPTFTIRKKASAVFTLENYVKKGILSSIQQNTILSAIDAHKNILIVGGTGSGKTTLANAVIDGIATRCPDDRLVIIEDTAELQCNALNTVILRSSDKISMNQLLRATMRLRPDRILVGEVRGQEALALLKAWNTGHPGGLATVHANNAAAGLVRLEQLIQESSITASMKPLVAEAVDIIVVIEKYNGSRRIKEIAEVTGLDLNKNYIISHIDN